MNLYNVVDKSGIHGVDPQNKVQRVIAAAKEDTEVFPMLNDYNPADSKWHGDVIGKVAEEPGCTRESAPPDRQISGREP